MLEIAAFVFVVCLDTRAVAEVVEKTARPKTKLRRENIVEKVQEYTRGDFSRQAV